MHGALRLLEVAKVRVVAVLGRGAAPAGAMPAVVWRGTALAAIGLAITLAVSPAAGALLVVGGIALLLHGACRVKAEGVPTANSPSVAEVIDSRVEALKDVIWELRESEGRYRDLLDTQENVIARRDGEGRLTYVNRAFCGMFGVSPNEVLGQVWQPQVLAEERPVPPAPGSPQRSFVHCIETASGRRWLAFEEHRVPGHGIARG